MATRPIKRTRSNNRAWSIETGMTKPQHLLKSSGPLPALYATRREARVQLETLKASFKLPVGARAVRVAVRVTTIGRG